MADFKRKKNKSISQTAKEEISPKRSMETVSWEGLREMGDKYEYKMQLNLFGEDDDTIESLMMPSHMMSIGGTKTRRVPTSAQFKIDALFKAPLYRQQKQYISMYYEDDLAITDIERMTRPKGLFDGLADDEIQKKIKSRCNVVQKSINLGMQRIRKHLTEEEWRQTKFWYKIK